MVWIKRVVGSILLASGLAAFGTYAWVLVPVSVDRTAPDAAVARLATPSSALGDVEEGYSEHKGRSLHYVSAGEGETIVFFHGFPSFWYSFARQMDHFGREYRVIAVDGLGAGKSDAPRDVELYTLEAMGEHIIALLDELKIERAHLVGHDWGSAFAIGLAQRYPARVLSVTGISAPSHNATLHALEVDSKARKTSGYVEQFKRANPPLIWALDVPDQIYDGAYRPMVEDGKLTPEEGALFRAATRDPKRINAHINWYRANLPHPDTIQEADYWPSRDARLTVPALYIWGADDPIYNEVAINRLLDLSDDARLITLPNTKHWPHVREAETVNRAIAGHIAKATAQAEDQSSNE